MSYEGLQFYDNDAGFQFYLQHRQSTDKPNDTLEKPMVLALHGNVIGALSWIWAVETPRWAKSRWPRERPLF